MGFPPEPAPERIPSPLLSARVRLRCTWCRDHLEREEGVFCAECLAPHHPECRATHGTCAAPGCGSGHLLRPEATPRRPDCGRALRVAAGLLLGLFAAAIGGWTAAWADACEPPETATLVPSPEVAAQVSPRSSEAEAEARSYPRDSGSDQARPPVHSYELTTIRLVTDGFAQGFELAPGDRLLFRSWSGSREVLRVPRSGPAELVLVAPATAAIEVRSGSGPEEVYTVVPADETCLIQLWGGNGVTVLRETHPEVIRRATR